VIIVGEYSFKGGGEIIELQFASELKDVKEAIIAVDSEYCKTKISKEKTMSGRKLYSPRFLNNAFKEQFMDRGWKRERIKCDYPTEYYIADYAPPMASKGAFREMDFIKKRVGVEIQFGKYAFMVYNVCAKMTIFHKLGLIDVGIEIVPIHEFAEQMSTGVSYFEQFVWDLEQRGIADIDIPVLILGISANK
jgi:hypothetical protein